MQEFDTIEEAFRWFLENVFPELPTTSKVKLRDVKFSYYSEDRKVSEKRMKRVLSEYGEFKTVYQFTKKEE
ncbi:hypothetical protein [uncultured Microscilla sp.]|uniref:hypothetical protein n=1 Tax=uncultured Microscilla sp. TaxID=432653 RepID=UPI00261639B2|nr:hypothetical protein [uncultured Microscilla sp.]